MVGLNLLSGLCPHSKDMSFCELWCYRSYFDFTMDTFLPGINTDFSDGLNTNNERKRVMYSFLMWSIDYNMFSFVHSSFQQLFLRIYEYSNFINNNNNDKKVLTQSAYRYTWYRVYLYIANILCFCTGFQGC